jgi:hypothetical protein
VIGAVVVSSAAVALPRTAVLAEPSPSPFPSTPSTSTSTSTSPGPGPVLGLTGGDALAFVAVVALVLGLLWLVPLLVDLFLADRRRTREFMPIVERMAGGAAGGAQTGQAGRDEMMRMMRMLERPPRGTEALVRSLIALVVLSLLGLTLATALISGALDTADLRKTIVTALLSILATIAGFYYGARTAQGAAEQTARQQRDPDSSTIPARPAGPRLIAVRPNVGAQAGGEEVTLFGSLLTGATSVSFGAIPASRFTVSSDSQITAVTPPGEGTVDVTASTPNGTSEVTEATKFTYNDGPGQEPPAPGEHGGDDVKAPGETAQAHDQDATAGPGQTTPSRADPAKPSGDDAATNGSDPRPEIDGRTPS